ncbi:hypothetical protein [Brachybacterium equifaecis]|nr:hypothetical protein [Brachybacterium equifaecis]
MAASIGDLDIVRLLAEARDGLTEAGREIVRAATARCLDQSSA